MLRAALARDLGVAAAEDGIVLADVHSHRAGHAIAACPTVELEGRPRASVLPRGEPHGVGRRVVRFARDQSGHLVVPVAVGRRARPDRHDHVRPERTDHGHDVREQRVVVPVLVRLLGGLREAEVERAREVLVPAVNAARREQFLGADGAQRLAELVTDEVLSAVTAREREIRRLDTPPPRQERDELRVLVVGMRGDHQHAARDGGSPHELIGGGGTALLRARRCRHGQQEQCERRDRRGDAGWRRFHTALMTPPASRGPLVRCDQPSASATMRACSSVCACVYPSAGLARSGRPT